MRSTRPLLPILVLVALAVVLSACGSDAPPPSSPSPSTTGAPSVGPVTTPQDAVAAVVAHEPRLRGIGPLDPEMIGQSAWVEVTPASGVGAFVVAVRVGWGDCPAGCINEHTWVYAVLPDGTVNLQSEGGDAVPPDAWPSPVGAGQTGLLITAVSGPHCPVVSDPPDPACEPRPVADASVIIRDARGREVVPAATDPSGVLFIELVSGDYVVEAQPVDGFMGTPAAVQVTVVDGAATPVDLQYDTGIR